MSITLGSASTEPTSWYVIDFLDNRDSEDPAEALLSPMTGAELERVKQTRLKIKTKRSDDAMAIYERREAALKQKIVGERVIEVNGVEIFDRASNEKLVPKNGSSLVDAWRRGPAVALDIIDDLYTALVDESQLKEGQRKNSNGRSDSFPQGTNPSIGGARYVEV